MAKKSKKELHQRKSRPTRISSAAVRQKKRKQKKRIVIMKRIFAGILVVLSAAGIGLLIINIPQIQLNLKMNEAEKYAQEASYEEAILTYENALQLDSGSVEVYRCMAGAYLDMKDEPGAKKVLMNGWETTQDESLLNYYCTVVLNEVVADLNNNQCTFETVAQIISVLEQDITNRDALSLLHTAYGFLAETLKKGDSASLFYDSDSTVESCNFTLYKDLMEQMFAIYPTAQDDESRESIKKAIMQYTVWDIPEWKISMHHMQDYLQIVEKSRELSGETEETESLFQCLHKQSETTYFFKDIFQSFDQGDFEAAKDFIVTAEYLAIRDAFLEGSMEYWSGADSIPVSREYVMLKQQDGLWTFSYPDFKENEETAGVITVWANKMTDDGVQRTGIAYEPSKETDNYYPHMEYAISYMNSNVQKEHSFEEMMNYHLETRTWTEEGMTTVMIGDWGGPYQWEKTY